MNYFKKNDILYFCAAAFLITSCSSSGNENGIEGEVAQLNRQLEQQNKRLEQQNDEIEMLRDSIGILLNNADRINTHAKHAEVDVHQAKTWASANGYQKTLVPYIDNVLYDLEAIRQYSGKQD